MNEELKSKLENLAYDRTIPFCYGCYKECPSGRCSDCYSDDLMRLLPGVGCEYGIEWVMDDILKSELTPVDSSESFEESVRCSYPETVKIGWMELDTVAVMKDSDPISWDMAVSEWEDQEAQDELIYTPDNGSTYFWTSEIEKLVDEHEARAS